MNIAISLCLSCKTPSYNSKIERSYITYVYVTFINKKIYN